jgi:hypothetical protein
MNKDCEHCKNEKKYDVILQTRNFEIELFWKRALFFWGFIASAFVAYAALVKDQHMLTATLIACFGFVCSISWSLANRGSKYWQENWEEALTEAEAEVTGPLFSIVREPQNKGIWLSAKKYSVSKIAIALSDFTCLVWLIIIFYPLIKSSLVFTCAPSLFIQWLAAVGSLIFFYNTAML